MRRTPAETPLLLAAAVAGLVHAAFSLHWALGGEWLLRTVGAWAVDAARDRPLVAGLLLAGVALVKAVVAVGPLWASSRWLADPHWWRVPAWLAAVALTAYGAVNTLVAWLVLGGALEPEGGYDRQAMVGHAWLWDPLFLLWGLLLGAGLLAGRGRPFGH